MSTKSSHTAYTTFLSVITGIYHQQSTGTGWTQPYATLTVTVTDPASYDILVGWEEVPITSSTESTTAIMSATPSTTAAPSTTSKLSMESLVGIALGCIIMGILFAVLVAWLWKRKRGVSSRKASLDGYAAPPPDDAEGENWGIVKSKAELPAESEKAEVAVKSAELSSEGGLHELGPDCKSANRTTEEVAELAG